MKNRATKKLQYRKKSRGGKDGSETFVDERKSKNDANRKEIKESQQTVRKE